MTEHQQPNPHICCVDPATGREIPTPNETVICLGNFDGVHRGHRELIRKAREWRDRDFPGAACGVFCFRELSSDFLASNPPAHLTTPEERMRQFSEAGAEFVLLADFSAIRDLSPSDFAVDCLRKTCRCVAAVCGFNYRFGKNAVGNADLLKKLLGAPLFVCEAVIDGGEPISSTRIRSALKEGRAEDAARMLGRPYAIEGAVCHGKELGRQLGFPTANQNFPVNAVIPRFGVYVSSCTVNGKTYRGVSNVGVHPTVDDPNTAANCETYILGYRGDLYGKVLRVAFLRFLRPEKPFSSVEALREQIAADASAAREE